MSAARATKLKTKIDAAMESSKVLVQKYMDKNKCTIDSDKMKAFVGTLTAAMELSTTKEPDFIQACALLKAVVTKKSEQSTKTPKKNTSSAAEAASVPSPVKPKASPVATAAVAATAKPKSTPEKTKETAEMEAFNAKLAIETKFQARAIEALVEHARKGPVQIPIPLTLHAVDTFDINGHKVTAYMQTSGRICVPALELLKSFAPQWSTLFQLKDYCSLNLISLLCTPDGKVSVLYDAEYVAEFMTKATKTKFKKDLETFQERISSTVETIIKAVNVDEPAPAAAAAVTDSKSKESRAATIKAFAKADADKKAEADAKKKAEAEAEQKAAAAAKRKLEEKATADKKKAEAEDAEKKAVAKRKLEEQRLQKAAEEEEEESKRAAKKRRLQDEKNEEQKSSKTVVEVASVDLVSDPETSESAPVATVAAVTPTAAPETDTPAAGASYDVSNAGIDALFDSISKSTGPAAKAAAADAEATASDEPVRDLDALCRSLGM